MVIMRTMMNKMSLLSKSTLLTTAVLVLGGGSWSPTMPGVKAFVVPIPTALPPHRSAAGVPSSGAPLRPHTLSTPSGVRAPLWHADSGARGRHSDPKRKRRFWQCLAASVSQRASQKAADPYYDAVESKDRTRVQIKTLLRVVLPSLAVGVISTLVFPGLALFLASTMNDAGVFTVLSQDSSQFVQNFLTVSGLLFSILVGQTYYFMYQQQESVYYALFNEVTEAKSLLEQVALVCQGRSMYQRCLHSIQRYVEDDLKQLQADPAALLSARPVDDPLESIMYMTSVGVPSTIYETVRSLRQARAGRLGALQRKLPQVHMGLLWILALIELVSFPLLGAGTQTIGGYNILTVEGILFGVMTSGIVLTLRVVGELWRPAGGAYNVDTVLAVMVRGLEEELESRMAGGKVYSSSLEAPSATNDPIEVTTTTTTSAAAVESAAPDGGSGGATKRLPVQQQQGADVGVVVWRIVRWIKNVVASKYKSS